MKRIVRFGLFLVLTCGALAFSLRKHTSDVQAIDSIRSNYLGSPGPSGKPVVIVFVHGLFGSGSDSWTRPNHISLPELLVDDPNRSLNADVFVFEYYSPRFGNAAKITQLAEQLRGALDDNGIWGNHKQVIFVAHSMGGLVVRQFLIAHREHIPQVPMLYFYATPTVGSEVTKVAQLLSSNPQLSGMLPLQGNEFLEAIDANWSGSTELSQIPTYCAYEVLPTGGIMVVPQYSAEALCNRLKEPINANHIDIVKPRDNRDPIYSRLASAIREAVDAPKQVQTDMIKAPPPRRVLSDKASSAVMPATISKPLSPDPVVTAQPVPGPFVPPPHKSPCPPGTVVCLANGFQNRAIGNEGPVMLLNETGSQAVGNYAPTSTSPVTPPSRTSGVSDPAKNLNQGGGKQAKSTKAKPD